MSRVRITGGEWRSRLIKVIESPGLRPTPDRVRETLFNWLGQDMTGLRCLDLFAGTGILGFEAASRGAAKVVMVESDRRVAANLWQNAETLGSDGMELVRADALEFAALAARQGRSFDLAFLDPPYRQHWLDKLWPLLLPIMAGGAKLYVEAEAVVAPPAPWRIVRQGQAGQVFFHLLERE
ncbi:MAG: 16S rRNA (guanine(966)-N(2))-methyltransferase RsmD [Gammaproteobacteria bacterium]|nr:16S rRNA (guanine(966)-N(2))-methyltransferase RsmD [Gammaproteobacteria bacterium]MBU1416329.1 16S rRNA (guanine(966)-N(2))-methyltransferase RsmD [Gammaproteobacteria bacterium]